MAKDKDKPKPDAKKGKKGKGKDAGKGGAAGMPSVANHPRAGAQVARVKAWGGLAGFALAFVLSWRAGVPPADLMLRALAGGVAGYVIAWAGAVAVWRHLVIAELRAVRSHRAAEAAARRAAQRAES